MMARDGRVLSEEAARLTSLPHEVNSHLGWALWQAEIGGGLVQMA